MNAIAEELTSMQPDREQFWKFKKVTQRSTSNQSKILMCRILLSSYNLIQAIYEVITFTRSSQMLPAWKFIKVTQRSTSNLVEILMSRTSLPIQLQHGAGKFWSIIIFTRSCKMLLWTWPSSKVKQRSTSNSSKILMWRISL